MSSDVSMLSDDDIPLASGKPGPSRLSHVASNGNQNGHAHDDDESMSDEDEIPLVCFIYTSAIAHLKVLPTFASRAVSTDAPQVGTCHSQSAFEAEEAAGRLI